MASDSRRNILYIGLGAVAAVLGMKYLFPLLLPFLLGAALAAAAEPLVSLLTRSARMPRGAAAGIGVTATLIALSGILSLLGALAVKQLSALARALPDVQQTAQQGILYLRDWLVGLTQAAPEGIQPQLTQSVLRLFGSSSAVLEQALGHLPAIAKTLLGAIPDGALGLGAGVLSAFMISARMPRIKQALAKRFSKSETYLSLLRHIRKSLGFWLRAQSLLALITFAIGSLGLLLLGIPHPLLLAFLIAVVDAVPLLGTGTVLIPWALVELLRGQYGTAIGLFVLYGVAAMTRTVLEPRLVGKQLGLDPLVTLLALYVGFRLWGILGMILAPLAAATVKEFFSARSDPSVLDNSPGQG